MNKFYVIGMISALFLINSLSVYAEEDNYTRPSDRVQSDKDGNMFVMQDNVKQTGRFTLIPNYLMGDVNRDGIVNAKDASQILQAAANQGAGNSSAEEFLKNQFSEYADENEVLLFADIDANGINAVDAAGVLVYSAEKGAGVDVLPLGSCSYYADENGNLQTGLIQDNATGMTYYVQENYMLYTGWKSVNEVIYYFDKEGVLQKGWFTKEGNTYYANEDGVVLTGWQIIEESRCHFNGKGILQKGWFTEEENTYYANETGVILTGWQTIEGNRYHFTEEGILQKDWFTEEENTYYANEEGIILTGWQTIEENKYYFYPENGAMAVNTSIDGINLGADGKEISEKLALNKKRAQNVFNDRGRSVSAIYSYMRSTNRYKYIESTRTLSQIESNGWLYYVDYAFTHYYGVCYYMAAKMDFLLREAGYTCRIVHATHGSGDHYWNQVYINGDWINYDCTNGYNAYSWSRIIKAGNYTFLGYVEPVYK